MNNSDLFHSWAHGLKSKAKASSCSYEGNFCYSYSTLIGILLKKGDKTLAVISSHTFSNTTSKHQGLAFRAVHSLYDVCNVDLKLENLNYNNVDKTVETLTDIYKKEIDETLSGLSNKRKKPEKIIVNLKYIFHNLKALYRFIDDESINLLSSEIAQKINSYGRFEDNFLTLNEWSSYAEDLYYNRNYKQVERKQKSKEEVIESWRKGKRQSLGNLRLNETLLRYRPNKDVIETSKGIVFSTDVAKNFWDDIQFVINTGVEKTVKYLHFSGVINSDGSLKIGCHSINYDEIVNLAKQLNLEVNHV